MWKSMTLVGDFSVLQYLCDSARCALKTATWFGQDRWQVGQHSTSSVLQPILPVVFVHLPSYALLLVCVLYSLLVLSFRPWFGQGSLHELTEDAIQEKKLNTTLKQLGWIEQPFLKWCFSLWGLSQSGWDFSEEIQTCLQQRVSKNWTLDFLVFLWKVPSVRTLHGVPCSSRPVLTSRSEEANALWVKKPQTMFKTMYMFRVETQKQVV